MHGVHMVLGPNGRPNGECYVEFASDEVADAALQKDRGTIGTRYVEVFRSTPEQMGAALNRMNKSNNMAPMAMQNAAAMQYAYGPFSMPAPMAYGGGSVPMAGMESVVKMRGLPYKVSRNDVLEFFTGLSVPLNGVHLMFNEREQPTGEAYVEFSSPDDRERAMTKDRQHIGGRYVELFRVNRAEMIGALEQFVGGYMSNNMHVPGGMAGAAPYAGMQPYPMQPPFGQPGYPMGGPACGGPGAYSAMQQPMGGPHGGPPMGAGAGAPAGKPGTLRMRGLPFRATVDDVLRFFHGFQVVQPGGVVIGHRDGRPSGEAWVTFANPAEAQRAMCLNNKNMGSRYVELFAA